MQVTPPFTLAKMKSRCKASAGPTVKNVMPNHASMRCLNQDSYQVPLSRIERVWSAYLSVPARVTKRRALVGVASILMHDPSNLGTAPVSAHSPSIIIWTTFFYLHVKIDTSSQTSQRKGGVFLSGTPAILCFRRREGSLYACSPCRLHPIAAIKLWTIGQGGEGRIGQ